MSHTNHHLWYHLVWSTKHRIPHFSKTSWKEYVGPTLYDIAKKHNIEKCFINGYKDHVHVLIRLDTTITVATIVKHLKGTSSRKFNELSKFNGKFEWQEGYFVCTISPDRIQRVVKYIKNQWEKHERFSFEKELEKWNVK